MCACLVACSMSPVLLGKHCLPYLTARHGRRKVQYGHGTRSASPPSKHLRYQSDFLRSSYN